MIKGVVMDNKTKCVYGMDGASHAIKESIEEIKKMTGEFDTQLFATSEEGQINMINKVQKLSTDLKSLVGFIDKSIDAYKVFRGEFYLGNNKGVETKKGIDLKKK